MPLTDFGRRAFALRADEWAVLVEGALLAAMVEAGLRLQPLSRLVTRVDAAAPARRAWPTERVPRLAALARWPYRVMPVPSSCLRRSLVLAWLLRRRGFQPRVRFGVRKHGSTLDAHAWVECQGLPLDLQPGASFAPLAAADATRSVRWSP